MADCTQCGRQMPPFSLKKICKWCVAYQAAQNAPESDVEVRQPVMVKPWERTASFTPYVTLAIFALNAAVFVGMALAGISLTDPTGAQLLHWGANYGPRTLGAEWWR